MNLYTIDRFDKSVSKNALTPGLWLAAILTAGLMPVTPFLPVWAAIVGWSLLTLVVVSVTGVFVYFAISKSDNLRSDEHSLKARALSIYGDGRQSPAAIARILEAPAISAREFGGSDGNN